MKVRAKSALTSAAFAAALSLGVGATAEAAVYSGEWDPAFGSIFPQLGWRGSADFFIPDACLSQPNATYASGSCGGAPMTVLSAEFSFYDLGAPGMTLETFRFGPGAAVAATAFVYQMTVTAGTLSGVDSAYFQGRAPATSKSIAGDGNYQFLLAFSGDEARLFYTPLGWSPSDARCFAGGTLISQNCGFNEAPAKLRFMEVSVVPEPGTYALMLGGVAAMGAWLRRRPR